MKCPICSSRSVKSHTYSSISKLFSGKEIFGCRDCQLHFANIMQPELNSYYINEYDTQHNNRSTKHPSPEQYFQNYGLQFKPDRSKLHTRLVEKYLKPKGTKSPTVIDFGAGFGTTLSCVQDALKTVKLFAYENSELCKPYLKYLNVSVLKGDPVNVIKDFEFSIDVAIMSHF